MALVPLPPLKILRVKPQSPSQPTYLVTLQDNLLAQSEINFKQY